MSSRFAGKVAVVIGGATGIGAATAQRLADEGAQVVIVDVAIETARKEAERITAGGGRALAIACDVTQEEDIRDAFARIDSEFGGLNALHVNVGDMRAVLADTNAVTVPLEIFDRTIAVNLRGHLLATRYAVPLMLRGAGGSIVYSSSRAAITSEPVRVSYAVSKSGLQALMRHVAISWGRQGIRANAVAPGTILTSALRALGPEHIAQRLGITYASRLGEPEDVAAAVAFLLSDEATFINGQILAIDGGVTMR